MLYTIDEVTRTIYMIPDNALAFQLNDGVRLEEMQWLHAVVCPQQESAAFVNAESISYIGKSATLCSTVFHSSERGKFIYAQHLSVGEAGFGSRFVFALSYYAHHVLGTTRSTFEPFPPVDAAASNSILTQRPRQRPDPRLIQGARALDIADLTPLDRLFVASTPTIGFSFRSCIANSSNAFGSHETTRRTQEREIARADYMLKSIIHLLRQETPPSKRVVSGSHSPFSPRPPSPFSLPPALMCSMTPPMAPSMLQPMSQPTSRPMSPTLSQPPISNLLHLPADVLNFIFEHIVGDVAKCVDSREAAKMFTKTRLVCQTFSQMIDQEGDDHVKRAKSGVTRFLRTGIYKQNQNDDGEAIDVSSHVYSTMSCSPFLLISLETATMRDYLLIRMRSQLGKRVCAARAAANQAHLQRIFLPARVDELVKSERDAKKDHELENRQVFTNANAPSSGRCSPSKPLPLPMRILQIVQIIQN